MTDTILVENLGELKRDERIASWFRSAEIPVNFFAGKPLPFIVIAEEEIAPELETKLASAVHDFLSLDTQYRDSISGLVYENYKQALELSDIEPLTILTEVDIWNFVHPKEIYLDRRGRRDEDIYVQVACQCDWDEHGLQLVFKRGQKITRVSAQDGHLTTSDAFDTPDSEDQLLANF